MSMAPQVPPQPAQHKHQHAHAQQFQPQPQQLQPHPQPQPLQPQPLQPQPLQLGANTGVSRVSLDNCIIKNRWRLIRPLGKGAFGEVYLAFDMTGNRHVAIKLESPQCKKPVLKLEVSIIQRMQASPYACSFVAYGRFIPPLAADDALGSQEETQSLTYSFMVMELLGPNVSDLRKKAGGKFSMATTALLARQMVRAIEAIHSIGFLHRDIKPGNFCIAPPKSEHVDAHNRPRCFLIDFGLSRRYLSTSGKVREPRSKVGFRGTARYASVAAHSGAELCRADDLWSLFYMVVEFLTGTLPWKGKEKDRIGTLKHAWTNAGLVSGQPVQMLDLYAYITSLSYTTKPDYDYICSLFDDMFRDSGARADTPYDWDTASLPMEHSNHAVPPLPHTSQQPHQLQPAPQQPEALLQRETPLFLPASADKIDPAEKDQMPAAAAAGFNATMHSHMIIGGEFGDLSNNFGQAGMSGIFLKCDIGEAGPHDHDDARDAEFEDDHRGCEPDEDDGDDDQVLVDEGDDAIGQVAVEHKQQLSESMSQGLPSHSSAARMLTAEQQSGQMSIPLGTNNRRADLRGAVECNGNSGDSAARDRSGSLFAEYDQFSTRAVVDVVTGSAALRSSASVPSSSDPNNAHMSSGSAQVVEMWKPPPEPGVVGTSPNAAPISALSASASAESAGSSATAPPSSSALDKRESKQSRHKSHPRQAEQQRPEHGASSQTLPIKHSVHFALQTLTDGPTSKKAAAEKSAAVAARKSNGSMRSSATATQDSLLRARQALLSASSSTTAAILSATATPSMTPPASISPSASSDAMGTIMQPRPPKTRPPLMVSPLQHFRLRRFRILQN